MSVVPPVMVSVRIAMVTPAAAVIVSVAVMTSMTSLTPS